MFEAPLSRIEQKIVCFMRDRVDAGGMGYVSVADFEKQGLTDEEEMQRVIRRFENVGLIYADSEFTWEINRRQVFHVARQIEIPPKRNWLREKWEWFVERPWSVVAVAVFLGVPALAAWILGGVFLVHSLLR